jgi:hypothetical protein
MDTIVIAGIIITSVVVLFIGLVAIMTLVFVVQLGTTIGEIKGGMLSAALDRAKLTDGQMKISNRVAETLRAVDTLLDISAGKDPFLLGDPFASMDLPEGLDTPGRMDYIKESMSDSDRALLSDLFISETRALDKESKKEDEKSDDPNLETPE